MPVQPDLRCLAASRPIRAFLARRRGVHAKPLKTGRKTSIKKLKVGINGFGRIGRVTLRLLLDRPDIEVVAVNDLTAPEANAHLLQCDSVHGTLKAPVSYAEGSLRVGDHTVALLDRKKHPAEIPWNRYGAELVFECARGVHEP
jgi:glyceraldehyde-3-phosphate dehydrogenase/erythrose-4-phosphate dehydrogenase